MRRKRISAAAALVAVLLCGLIFAYKHAADRRAAEHEDYPEQSEIDVTHEFYNEQLPLAAPPSEDIKPEVDAPPLEAATTPQEEKPAQTDKPAHTKEPTQTEKPAQTKEPTETEEPAQTKEPAQTEETALTEEPPEVTKPLMNEPPEMAPEAKPVLEDPKNENEDDIPVIAHMDWEYDATMDELLEECRLISAPQTLVFDTVNLSGESQLIGLTEEWKIQILDMRDSGSWRLTATAGPLTAKDGTHTLINALVFIQPNGDITYLSPDESTLIAQKPPDAEAGITELNRAQNEGFHIYLNPNEGMPGMSYTATIVWKLEIS